MGVLKHTRAYTIGAMQYANGEGWRNYVKAELQPREITVFDPYHKPFLKEIHEDEAARQQYRQWMEDGEYDKVAAAFQSSEAWFLFP